MSESRPMAFTKVVELSKALDFSHLAHARSMSKANFIDKLGLIILAPRLRNYVMNGS